MDAKELTRRRSIQDPVATTAGMAGLPDAALADSTGLLQAHHDPTRISLTVNGQRLHLDIDVRSTLLHVLREDLRLTGTKAGCTHGECGACTVLLDGKRANACLILAIMADGREITTIEGLARNGELHPIQAAFIEHDAFGCGYCTSGQIVSAVGCIREGHAGSSAEIHEYMSGNLCRCGAHADIVAAIETAARNMGS